MLNIGICDDSALQRTYIKLIIHDYESRSGVRFNLYEFSSGEELLEKFKENHELLDLYFLDHRMKNLTGLEAASYIRQHNKACSIVFVTASDEQEGFEAVSPLRILDKPARPSAIYDILDQVLAERMSPSHSGQTDCS